MKRILSVLMIVALLGSSCGKNDSSGCQPVSPSAERSQLIDYCKASSINYTEDVSGLFYEIVTPGSGIAPTATSTVSVVYTGKLLNGTTFDATANPVNLPLSSVIDGWKIGLPLIKKGGRIKLIIPSALAYSCTGAGTSIPPNTPLYFDVTLNDVK